MSDPWVKFYPSDWLAGTRGLTAAETGVYITLVAMMYEREEPLDMPVDRLARLCGSTKTNFKKAISVLLDEGRIVQTDSGLWSKRVECELQKRTAKTNNAKSSANARWGKTKQKQGLGDAVASETHMRNGCDGDATRNQKPEYTVPYGTDADGVEQVEIDLPSEPETEHQRATKAVWQRGPAFLAECGVPQGSARSVIGKWLKDSSPQSVFDALADAKKCGTQDPVSYITKALQKPEITGADIQDMVAQIVKEMPKP